jgi:K+-transporting ATPase KdpF subunit
VRTPALTRRSASPSAIALPAMENLVIGLIALALLVYLLVAVLRPEKF